MVKKMDKETATWNDLTGNWVNAWTDAGTQIWKTWFNQMGVATANGNAETQPDMTALTERFTQNQQLLMRFLKLSFEAWQDILPKVQAGDDWQKTLTNYTTQIRKQLDDFSQGNQKINQDTTQLWQLYSQQIQKFNQVWTAYMESSLGPLNQTWTGNSQPWIELNNLYWEMFYQPTFGNFLQSPTLGVTREFNNKILKGFDQWTNLYRASNNYQILLSDIQVKSFEALIQKLVELAEKGEPVTDWRKFQDLWSIVSDDIFEKTFMSEENLKVHGDFLNALNAYRIQQQELMESWMKAMNMPSRSEVDEIHKTIYELRKEVKRLKKTVAKYEQEVDG
ncbi:putative poly(3-hydroxyalkanoate) synthase component [Planktothrix serta PCC 8927]|uniref:Poly(3-hydroxyalkanoate) polymerase subunit PhaE n=2 Tax=Planktothrix TaxID=54304 RepID=A0A7Z9E5H9_9CYAN|nr:putative poly(3-hydroxyalkanoate) synthase component [Planktothrix serta PCC 8927]